MSHRFLSNPAPLRVITASLNDMPNRLRLLAACIEEDQTAYMDTVVTLLLECADKLDGQLVHLRSHCFPKLAQKECHD